MDISTLLGILIGFGALILGFILEGGHISALFLLPPAIIVFGGTFGAVFASFPLKEMKKFPTWIKIA
ncbi:MAG TPA: motility protein A, partial [Desulfitobacterium dehalogenans]|nr:motility protein A [Desulfitobacterium dehalogenans]